MALLVFLGACQTTTTVEPFYRPGNARIEQAYLSPEADFSRYTKLMASPIEIYFPEDAPRPSEADLDRLRETFRTAFRADVGTDSGPDVLHVIAQIVDLKITGEQGTFVPTGRLQQIVSRGQLTLLMELRDSVTGKVLARAAETSEAELDGLCWQRDICVRKIASGAPI
jgi:hypothetical protein